jgi:hypothetical protein
MRKVFVKDEENHKLMILIKINFKKAWENQNICTKEVFYEF